VSWATGAEKSGYLKFQLCGESAPTKREPERKMKRKNKKFRGGK
jgi:hypothetical protein